MFVNAATSSEDPPAPRPNVGVAPSVRYPLSFEVALIEHDRRLVVQLPPVGDVRVQRESLQERVVVGELEGGVRGRLVRIGRRVERRRRHINGEPLAKLDGDAEDRVDLIPPRRRGPGAMRVEAVPDAGREGDVGHGTLIGRVQLPQQQHQRLDDEAFVFHVQAARCDVVIGDIPRHQHVDIRAK